MKNRKHRYTALLLALSTMTAFMTACGNMEKSNEMYNAAPGHDYSSQGSYDYDAADDADAEAEDGGSHYEVKTEDGDAYTNSEEYASIVENGFVATLENPLSTFSADVDTASYSNVRRMIQDGAGVNPDAVRIEEMINYFSYDYPEPTDGAPFSVTTEMYDCPWNTDNQLFLIGMQAEKIDLASRAPMNLVFLIDVSGSMYTEDKLPLVQKAVVMLAEELNENDRVSIVTYAGQESVVLEGVPGNETNTIVNAIYSLSAGGATAGERGIQMAYEIAQRYYIEGGNNRVLLSTDGDLNVGISSAEELTRLVEEKRESGVNLSVLGFGTGNLKDDRLEALADNGNGNYAYIDSELEARKVLVHEMGGTLYTVAKDVKFQTEFNPEMVEGYRLIGYENRILAAEDFNNDAVDAGEVGSGHSVTALYELILTEKAKLSVNEINLKYQQTADTPTETELMTISMRYKEPDGDVSELREYPIMAQGCRTPEIGKNLAFAAAVTEFGMLVGQRTPYNASYAQIKELLSKTDIQDAYRQEFVQLVEYLNDGSSYTPAEPAVYTQPEAPVPQETNIAYAGGSETHKPEVYATYQGNAVPLQTDAITLAEIAEADLDVGMILNMTVGDDDFEECAENGLLVRIYYNSWGAQGKSLRFRDGGNETYLQVNDMALLFNAGYDLLVVNTGGFYQVCPMPAEIYGLLKMEFTELEQNQ